MLNAATAHSEPRAIKSRFIFACLIAVPAAIALDCLADDPPSPEQDPDLVALVDPILHWQARKVAARQNAWTLWVKAAEVAVKAEVEGLSASSPSEPLTPIGASDDQRQKLSRWVKRNEDALRFLDLGLARPEAHLRAAEGALSEISGLMELKDLHRARLVRAELAALAGSDARAVDDVLAALRFGDRVTMSDGVILSWLVGVSCQTYVMKSTRRLHEADLLSAAQCRRLIAGFEDAPPPGQGLAQAIRHEFWRIWVWDAREMAKLREQGGALAQFKRLGELMESEPAPQSSRIWRRIDLLAAKHDRTLFKFDEVMEFGSRHHADRVRSIGLPWSAVRQETLVEEDEMKKRRDAVELKAKAFGETLRAEDGAPGEQRVDEALDGTFSDMFMASLILPPGGVETSDRLAQSRRRALTIVLAVHVYADQHGAPPTTLEDLVDKRLLTGVPIDPFADKPFHYDPERLIVWSVGEDGDDDGGKGLTDDPAKQFTGEDYVWRISLPKKSAAPTGARRGRGALRRPGDAGGAGRRGRSTR